MKNLFSQTFLNKKSEKVSFSVFLITVLIGIFILCYYLYSTLSHTYFKQEYQNYFLEVKAEITSKILQTLEQGEEVNINRIMEPYLDEEIDLLVVYRNDGEIIQIFTKKGITRENLRKLDSIYNSHQENILNLYFWEEGESPKNSATASNDERGIYDLSFLALAAINLESEEVPYHYLLVFNLEKYQSQSMVLQNTINRRSFYGGVIALGLIGLVFMIREIKQRREKKREQEALHKKRVREEVLRIAEERDLLKNVDQNLPPPPEEDEEEIVEKSTNSELDETKLSIHDQIQHDQEDEFFNQDDLIEKNWVESEPKANLQPIPHPHEKGESIKSENGDREEWVSKLYSEFMLNLGEAEYEEISDIYSEDTIEPQPRAFTEIIEQRENWEQKRAINSRLKKLLGVWLFAQPIPQENPTESKNEFITQLIFRSLEVIGSSNSSEPDEKVFQYPPPAALLYFCPENPSQEITQSPVLTTAFPQHLYHPDKKPSTVSWLGREKDFFKKGLPYVEKKSLVTTFITPRVIDGIPHIVKALYTSANYKHLLYEQKLELLYLIEVMLDGVTYFEKLYHPLSRPGSLEKKVKYFFEFIFDMDSTRIKLLMGSPESPTLHISLWAFEKNTYPHDIKISFWDMMEKLTEQLRLQFQEQELFFLSEKDQILSVGYNLPVKEVSISEKIKSVIEKTLIEEGGMGVIQLEWKETPLQIPEPDQKETKNKGEPITET